MSLTWIFQKISKKSAKLLAEFVAAVIEYRHCSTSLTQDWLGVTHCYHCCSTQSWSWQRLDWYQLQKKYFKTMFPEISILRFEDFYIPANSAFIRLTVLVDLETAGIEPDAS